MSWLPAFALTLAIELPIVLWVVGASSRRRASIDVVAANLLTHPAGWWLVRSALWPWVVVEILVTITEAGVYRAATGLPWKRAALASLTANGVTAALSFAV